MIGKIRSYVLKLIASPAFIFYCVNILLVHPVFFPELHDLGLWDEAAFIQTGQIAFLANLPRYSSNPLAHLLFRSLFLIFGRSPFWMVHLASASRFLLFSLLWLGTYRVAARLKDHAHPLIVMGMFFVLPFSLGFLTYPTDPLFAGLAALSLAALLGFHQEGEVRHLYQASIFMALAALARNDGLVLFGVLIFLAAVIAWRKPIFVRAMAAVSLPFLVIVFGYVGIRGLQSGDFSLGTMERTYENFESGQVVLLTTDEGVGGTTEARVAARQIFGTPEENDYSVLKAILKAPDVYLQRLSIVLRGLPVKILTAYGKQFASVLFLLALWGGITLLRQKRYRLLTILVVWPVHLLTGAVITIFRFGHLLFPFYIVLVLASIGLVDVFNRWRERPIWGLWTAVLAVLAVYGVVDNKLAVTSNAGLVLLALWIADWLRRRNDLQVKEKALAGWLVLLAAGIILRGGFPSLKVRVLGDDPREQALLALNEYLDAGDLVATREPGMVWAARMTPLTLASTDVPIDLSPEAFMTWLIDQGTQAVYVDHLYAASPAIWEKIQPFIGTELERVFIADGGDIQLLLVTQNQED